jgi:hypothetical protein
VDIEAVSGGLRQSATNNSTLIPQLAAGGMLTAANAASNGVLTNNIDYNIRIDPFNGGSDATGSRNGGAFSSLTNGMAAALPGDIIYIGQGTQFANAAAVSLPSPVRVLGASEILTVIETGPGNSDSAFRPQGAGDEIAYMTIISTNGHTTAGSVDGGTNIFLHDLIVHPDSEMVENQAGTNTYLRIVCLDGKAALFNQTLGFNTNGLYIIDSCVMASSGSVIAAKGSFIIRNSILASLSTNLVAGIVGAAATTHGTGLVYSTQFIFPTNNVSSVAMNSSSASARPIYYDSATSFNTNNTGVGVLPMSQYTPLNGSILDVQSNGTTLVGVGTLNFDSSFTVSTNSPGVATISGSGLTANLQFLSGSTITPSSSTAYFTNGIFKGSSTP